MNGYYNPMDDLGKLWKDRDRKVHQDALRKRKADSTQSVSPADRTAEKRVIEGAERASQTEQQQLY
jgi:hypothetical protein